MREGRRCHSRWLKENKIIDLRLNREISSDATKMLKRNVISGTLGTDINSEILSRDLKRGVTEQTKQLALQFGTQSTSRSFCPSGAGRAGEEQGNEEVSSAA